MAKLMADVVTITGKPDARGGITEDGPHAGVIEALELLLQDAKAGRIVGLRIVTVDKSSNAHGMIVGFASYSMLGMMYQLTNCLANELDDEE